MADLWMPGAEKVPGHPDKVGYQALGFGIKGPKKGDVKHSAEGWGEYLKFLVQTRLAIKSWHFSVLTDGTIWQHYPINVHCWHAGDTDDDDDVRANIELEGIEHEGLVGTTLTAEQVQATVEITKFCADYFDRDAIYSRFPIMPTDGWTLVEHNQVSNSYTACPSDRIPWDLVTEQLTTQEVDDMALAFWKAPGSPTVFLVNGFTRRPMHGERDALAAALNISPQVRDVANDLMASLKEA